MNKYINKMASLYRFATLLSNINHNLFICILVSIVLPTSERADAKAYGRPNYDGERRLTKEYQLRQGSIRGLIVQPGPKYSLQSVEMFLGIPYAAPPVGNLRFMPPGSALPWVGVKIATEFAPVCPQMLPAENKNNPLSPGRQQYMKKILPFLEDESEDCLYLNVYAPKQEHKPKKLPVLVFIHGDSFEWSSGNPYDGRILASYGNVMVVTLNFRLGILGFMKPSLTDHAYGNNGLLDQMAALQWIQDNIVDLNGDPNAVSLMGHGTGAACVNFMMISPIIPDGLFHRAILMSGSALSDWALTKDPMQYTIQVAQHLNCHTSNNTMACLQYKRLSDLKKVQILARKFATPLGPMVAGSFIPNEPSTTIESYPNIFGKYEMLSGVTELESYHEFRVIELGQGVIEKDRDELIQQYSEVRFEAAPDVAARDIKKQYFHGVNANRDWGVNANRENRDYLLDALSDARTVAPLMSVANHHSTANPRSYFYVFGHNSEHTDYAALHKSVQGEELPYVFGVPLGGADTHFHEEYTAKEKLLSEVVMRRWTNFIKLGTPNTQRTEQYLTPNKKDWNVYNMDWPEYNVEHQTYLHIDLPTDHFVRSLYRANYTKFWNEVLPNKMKNYAVSPLFEYEPVATTSRPRKTISSPAVNEKTNWKSPSMSHPYRPPVNVPVYGKPRQQYIPPSGREDTEEIYKEIKSIKTPARTPPPFLEQLPKIITHVNTPPLDASIEPPGKNSSATVGIIIAIGSIFIIVNLIIFATLYLKKRKLQVREQELKRDNGGRDVVDASDCYNYKPKEMTACERFKSRYSEIKIVKWIKNRNSDNKPKQTKLVPVKTPKSDDSGGFRQRFKLRRHLSSSTIDANTKVRDWIANEIKSKCSPTLDRKHKLNVELESPRYLSLPKSHKSDDLLNKKTTNNSKDSLNISLNEQVCSTMPHKKAHVESNTRKTSEKTTSTSAHDSHSSISNSKEKIYKSHKTTSKSNDSIATSEGKKSNKVSIAIDATPASRTSAILRQRPIELSKSFDTIDNNPLICNEHKAKLKRSKTENDFDIVHDEKSQTSADEKDNPATFTSVVNFSLNDEDSLSHGNTEIIKISHKHSASDPVKDINYDIIVQYTDTPDIPPPISFRNNFNVNVTSKDESDQVIPLTPAEALLTIKRRNYPKVLPDFPRSMNKQKRYSLQPSSFQTFKNYVGNEFTPKDVLPKTPPIPPPRTTSTLDRRVAYKNSKISATSSFDSGKMSLGSFKEKNTQKNEDYCNIEALSTILSDSNTSNTSISTERCTRKTGIEPYTRREFPKIIIAANDISNTNEPNIIIKQTLEHSIAEIKSNVPRVRLPDNFHSLGPESERSDSSLSTISDIENDLEDEAISDAELIEALVSGIDTSFDQIDIPDTKGPDDSYVKKLEIIQVKLNTEIPTQKNYETVKFYSDDILPDVSDLEKRAQIKRQTSLNKLQRRSETLNQPPEKAVSIKEKKIPKSPPFQLKSTRVKRRVSKLKQKSEKKKTVSLQHSCSGSSNDTESSTGTVKYVPIKK